jgi:hypothetical protein
MSNRKTSKDTRNATFLPESAGGRMLSNLPSGHQLDLFGPDHAHVNPFRWQGLGKALKTKGIFGRNSHDSSASANLQLSLESRLRQRLDVNGSPEYDLTWKRWDMQSGPPICALRALARRTSGSVCSGWPTPACMDTIDAKNEWRGESRAIAPTGKLSDKVKGVQMAGWPTPNTPNGGRATPPGTSTTGKTPDGKKRQVDLQHVARSILSSGQAPSLSHAPMENGGGCLVAGWETPNAMDGGQTSRGGDRKDELLLGGQAKATMPPNTTLKLNPLFSLWLMGFPAEWAYCVVPEMQSCPR